MARPPASHARAVFGPDPISDAGPESWARLALAGCALAPTLLAHGWDEPLLPLRALAWCRTFALGAYLAWGVIAIAHAGTPSRRRLALARSGPVELAVCALGLAGLWAGALGSACAVALAALRLLRAYVLVIRSRVPAGVSLVGAFALLTLAGAAALKLPAATPDDQPIGWIDALFTSTSATCVTGLIVRDTAFGFERFGQGVILALIQAGGLGIALFAVLAAVLAGSRVSIRAGEAVGAAAAGSPANLRRVVIFVVAATVLIESIGAAALLAGWPSEWADSLPGGAEARPFHALFFSISAFCNAGFATAPDSLESLRLHWTSHLVIAPLIVLGGIGYPVLRDVLAVGWQRLRARRTSHGRLVRLTLHTKLALCMTAVLYAAGLAAVALSDLAQSHESIRTALLDAHFMSISARTAGFNTAPMGELGPLARFALTVLIFIGGSPGSAAGGVKTIAIAVLLLTVWSTVRGREEPEVFGRRIAQAFVSRAAVLITLGILSVATVVGLLSVTEARPGGPGLEELLFESVSACSTVGLSLGVTDDLTPAGRVVIIGAMFVGRVGPLAALASLVAVARRSRGRYEYASEDVIMS